MLNYILWFPSAFRNVESPLFQGLRQMGKHLYAQSEKNPSHSENFSCLTTIDPEYQGLRWRFQKVSQWAAWVNGAKVLTSLEGRPLASTLARAGRCLSLDVHYWNSTSCPFDSLTSFPEFSGQINHFLWASLGVLGVLKQRPSWLCSYLMVNADGHQACLLLRASGPGSYQEMELWEMSRGL